MDNLRNLDQIQDDDGWRWYKDKDTGEMFVSVTTVLGNTLANPKLNAWKAKNTKAYTDRVAKKASDFGSKGHLLFADILEGKTIDLPETHIKPVQEFVKWTAENEVKPKHIEMFLYSDKLGVAGATDFIGDIKGKETVADWKLTNRYKITNGFQLAAYKLMAQELNLVSDDCGMMGVQYDKRNEVIKSFPYTHLDWCELQFLCAVQNFKGLYFYKLQKMNWPWLHNPTVKPIVSD